MPAGLVAGDSTLSLSCKISPASTTRQSPTPTDCSTAHAQSKPLQRVAAQQTGHKGSQQTGHKGVPCRSSSCHVYSRAWPADDERRSRGAPGSAAGPSMLASHEAVKNGVRDLSGEETIVMNLNNCHELDYGLFSGTENDLKEWTCSRVLFF